MNIIKKILFFSFIIFIFSLVFSTSTDFTQDLGRHLKLGEIIVKTKTVPKTNLFSYTNPNFPFINHHWLSEVIFYLSSQLFGLNFLNIIKVFLILLSVGVVLRLALKKSSMISVIISGLIFSPILLERNDIRPEIFGYLFFSIILYLLLTYPNNQKIIYFLPLIMLLWINIHITFIFGVFLIFLLIMKIFFSKNRSSALLICFLSIFIIIFNPHGLIGIFYPLNIFKNYGYTIVENQNLFYLNQMTFNPLIKYFFFISPIIIFSLIVLILVNQLTEMLILSIFFIMTFLQLRHLPFFILTAIPSVALVIDLLIRKREEKWINIRLLLITLLIFINFIGVIFFVSNQYNLIFDTGKKFGLGYVEFGDKAVNLIKKNNLKKNIFNNFDIGGYSIYKLYPEYKVFIDNRPEAYPADFMEKVYKDLQIYPENQEKIFKKYKINTVFFSHTDQTQWAEIFVGRILKDKNWRLVYLDPSIFIATKDNRFIDIRVNKKILKELINQESDYLSLLKLSRVFSLMDEKDLAETALVKAEELNPNSCSIKKYLFNQYASNLNFYLYRADELRKNSWYCF